MTIFRLYGDKHQSVYIHDHELGVVTEIISKYLHNRTITYFSYTVSILR